MEIRPNTYGDMLLLIDGYVDRNGRVRQASVITPIRFDGIDTLSDIYDQRFKQPEGNTITYHVAGRDLTFDYDHGMQLWDIADKLFWEYQELANPEITELMQLERQGKKVRPQLSMVR